MKMMLCVLTALLLSTTFTASANDAVGEALFEENCSECHRASNYSGGNPNRLAELIGKIISNETKHKVKITLDHEQVAAVARYMTDR